MKITMTGNDGKKIASVVFEIHSADTNALVWEVTTSSSGYVWSSYMPLGDYYAVEKAFQIFICLTPHGMIFPSPTTTKVFT